MIPLVTQKGRVSAADGIALVGNMIWLTVSEPDIFDGEVDWATRATWFVCLISMFADMEYILIQSKLGKKVPDEVTSIIGGSLGVLYTVFGAIGWGKRGIHKDGFAFANDIFLYLQSIGRVLVFPALVEATYGITLLIEVTLDGICCVLGVVGGIVTAASWEGSRSNRFDSLAIGSTETPKYL